MRLWLGSVTALHLVIGGVGRPPTAAAATSGCPLVDVIDGKKCPRRSPGGEGAAAPAVAVIPVGPERLRMMASEGLLGNGVGSPQGIALDAANEAAQILGQIVVDRASAEGFRLLRDRLEALLLCEGASVGKPGTFPATCEAIANVRIQDLGMAPQALMAALLEDLTWQILPQIGEALGGKEREDLGAMFEFVRRDVSPQLAKSVHRLDPTVATLIVSRMRVDGTRILAAKPGTVCSQTTDSQRADASLSFATAAVGACYLQTDYDSPALCPVASVVTKIYADACPAGAADVRDMSTKLALELLTSLTATGDKSKPDVSARLHAGTNQHDGVLAKNRCC